MSEGWTREVEERGGMSEGWRIEGKGKVERG